MNLFIQHLLPSLQLPTLLPSVRPLSPFLCIFSLLSDCLFCFSCTSCSFCCNSVSSSTFPMAAFLLPSMEPLFFFSPIQLLQLLLTFSLFLVSSIILLPYLSPGFLPSLSLGCISFSFPYCLDLTFSLCYTASLVAFCSFALSFAAFLEHFLSVTSYFSFLVLFMLPLLFFMVSSFSSSSLFFLTFCTHSVLLI